MMQYSGDTFQEISASWIGPVQPTALNFTPTSPQVSKVHRSLCAFSAFPGYKLKYFWWKSWPKFLCTSPILGKPAALEITLYWTWELCRIHERKLPGNATANFKRRKQAMEYHKTITEHSNSRGLSEPWCLKVLSLATSFHVLRRYRIYTEKLFLPWL